MRNKICTDAFSNIILQLSIIISGIILPHLIIFAYGSEVNGMISSINQFLSYITLLESGIGGVIRSQLYKPLLNKDSKGISGIVKASNNFFKKIGFIFILYLLLVACSFKYLSDTKFDWVYVFSLVIILGISILIQYFIGLTYQIVIQADQHYTFTSAVQIITLWSNLLFTSICIKKGGSIHLVKLMNAVLFSLRPICYYLYATKKYSLNKKVKPDNYALKQRWNGFAHHIAYFIHSNTDVVLLTFFSSLVEVSVYSVYLMVATGVRSIISAVSSAFEPYFGRLIASDNKELLKKNFEMYELFHLIFSSFLFGAAFVLIIPFIKIYTSGITDIDYVRVTFSILILSAEYIYCLRNPYSIIIFASGLFKQTQRGAFIEALINITISLILIKPLGINGVAIGTLIAMIYRTVDYVIYLNKHILKRNIYSFIKKICSAMFFIIFLYLIFNHFDYQPISYFEWIKYAIIVTIVSMILCLLSFAIIDYKNFISCLILIKNKTKG